MKKITIDKLNAFYKKHPHMAGTPATDSQIADAEQKLGVKFSDDYIEFIKLFGGGYAGIDIFFCTQEKTDKSVIIHTNWLRESHPEIRDTYVIADDGAGNPIMIDAKGQVLIYYHDNGESEVLAQSLGEFIDDNFEPW